MEKKCKNCGKETEYMYHFNQGLYCEECKTIGMAEQEQVFFFENMRERFKSIGNSFMKPHESDLKGS